MSAVARASDALPVLVPVAGACGTAAVVVPVPVSGVEPGKKNDVILVQGGAAAGTGEVETAGCCDHGV